MAEVNLMAEPRDWYVRDETMCRPYLFSSPRDDPKLSLKIADSVWCKPFAYVSLSLIVIAQVYSRYMTIIISLFSQFFKISLLRDAKYNHTLFAAMFFFLVI
jgi:hypothetical protein